MLVQVVNEQAGIIGLEIAAVVGDNLAVGQRDEVAADGEVAGLHLVADGGGLERAATLIDFIEVVA